MSFNEREKRERERKRDANYNLVSSFRKFFFISQQTSKERKKI